MQLYNCNVRLNNSLMNHVFKQDVTAAEIAIIRYIHSHQTESSGDPVVDIVAFDWRQGPDDEEGKPTKYKVPKGTVRRTDTAEKARLSAIYSMGETSGSDIVLRILGVGAAQIPHVIEGVEVPDDETPRPKREPIPVAEPTVPPVRMRVPPRAASAESVTV